MLIDKIKFPSRITDLVENANYYIHQMRINKDEDEIPKFLKDYAWKFFRNIELDRKQLELLILYYVDNLYRFTMCLELFDRYSVKYLANVIPFVMDSFQNRSVDIFYILDNELREDRCKSLIDIFGLAGMKVVTPQEYNLEWELVEKEIINCIKPIQNIAYIEKNSEVNFLDKVVELAKKTSVINKDSRYLIIFRNQGSETSDVEIIQRSVVEESAP